MCRLTYFGEAERISIRIGHSASVMGGKLIGVNLLQQRIFPSFGIVRENAQFG